METPIDRPIEREIEKMNTDFTASVKPAFSNVVDNFNTADHLYITAWTGLCAIYAHTCGTKPRVRGLPTGVYGGLIGLSFAFGGVYLTTAARMGLFTYKK